MATEYREGAGVASSDPGLSGFFEATYRRAYSLAFRVTGDSQAAEAATESAYRRLSAPFSEERLFDFVRQDALSSHRRVAAPMNEPAATASSVQTAFSSLGTLERTALELAYSGGMTAAEIAALLEKDEATVRAALRAGLLHLGKLAAGEVSTP